MKRQAAVLGAAALAAGAIALRRGGIGEDLEWSEVQKPGALVEIDGYRVHYVEAGSGPAIVLVHGLGGCTYNFREQMAALSQAHRVVAVDLKGFGYSERGTATDLSATGQVRMLRSFIDALGIGRAAFVGHSMGGGIVQRFAAAYPDAVDALVLAASVRAGQHFDRRLPGFVERPLMRFMAHQVAPRTLGFAYGGGAPDATVREETLRPLRLRGTVDGFLRMGRDRRSDPPVDVGRIRQPVLLLWGDHDRVVPLRVARQVREDLPQARLVVIHGAGHMLFEERPRDCNAAVIDFLQAVAAPVTGRW